MGQDGGPSIRYTAVRTAPHSFKEANQNLLDILKAYGEQPEMAQEEEINFFWVREHKRPTRQHAS